MAKPILTPTMETLQNRTRSGKALAVATLVAIIGTLLVNTLSNFFPPGGQNVGEIANTILSGVLITPENYAFAIWGIIYLGLIAYGIYQFENDRRRERKIQQAKQASHRRLCRSNHMDFSIYPAAVYPLNSGHAGHFAAADWHLFDPEYWPRNRVSRLGRWAAHIPFSIYLGWISVATIVNIASALYVAGWNGWGLSDVIWTAIMIGVATLLGAIVIWRRGDIAFSLVFVWAFVAIALANGNIPAIWITAVLGSRAAPGLPWSSQAQKTPPQVHSLRRCCILW